MYFNGFYHLFYQYNPKGAVWGNIVWAHSVSKDMINRKSLDPAIYPTKPFFLTCSHKRGRGKFELMTSVSLGGTPIN
jgi:sucrose-6-phosphate hydrolase SacC (GH32 family)